MLSSFYPALPAERMSKSSKGEVLEAFLDVLARNGVQHCILKNYRDCLRGVAPDVDIVLDPDEFADLCRKGELARRGLRVVHWFRDEGALAVVTGCRAGGWPALLRLDMHEAYRSFGIPVYGREELLASRRRPDERRPLWAAAIPVEFGVTLAGRAASRRTDEAVARRLSELFAAEPELCRHEAGRLFGPRQAAAICDAAEAGACDKVERLLPGLHWPLKLRLFRRRPGAYLLALAARQWRRWRRWTSAPSGLHVVFLGPDGAGKSTLIDAIRERLADAFLGCRYGTFPGGILPARPKGSPHALPPRSLPASALKAAWWLGAYTLGYYRSVYPVLVRGGLVIHHRYLLDVLVDPRRYRYSGPASWVEAIWKLAPKPHLIFVLDAPAEEIYRRKQEISVEEIERQRFTNRQLAARIPNLRLVDTSRPVENSVADIVEAMLANMEERSRERLQRQ